MCVAAHAGVASLCASTREAVLKATAVRSFVLIPQTVGGDTGAGGTTWGWGDIGEGDKGGGEGDKGGGGRGQHGDIWPVPRYHFVLALKGLRTMSAALHRLRHVVSRTFKKTNGSLLANCRTRTLSLASH